MCGICCNRDMRTQYFRRQARGDRCYTICEKFLTGTGSSDVQGFKTNEERTLLTKGTEWVEAWSC